MVWALASALVAMAGVAFYATPWGFGQYEIFDPPSDYLYQQAVFQMHAQVGLFGSTEHLSWPVGADPWRLPQWGVVNGLWAWFSVGVLGMGTAAAVQWSAVIAAGVNVLAMWFFLTSFTGRSNKPLVAALSVILSASVMVATVQLNIAYFYVVPLALGVLARMGRASARGRVGLLVGLAAAVAVSPLWWAVVMVLLLPFLAVAPAVRARWRGVLAVLLVWLATAAGVGVQVLIYAAAAASGPGADTSREPWSSNYFGGHIIDVVRMSPAVEALLPGLVARFEGGYSLVGAPGIGWAVTTVAALVALLAVPPRRLPGMVGVGVLAAGTVAAALYWFVGGLGNLQAAVAVLAGTTSPARAWLRMYVVLGVLGAAWLVAVIRARQVEPGRWALAARRPLVWALAGVLMLGWVADLVVESQDVRRMPGAAQPEVAAVAALTAARQPCPVAQLPDDTLPIPVVGRGTSAFGIPYRSLAPYVMAPDFYWSAGSADETARVGLAAMPPEMGPADAQRLRELGFCAVLFDSVVAGQARAEGAEVPGRSVDFDQQPIFTDDRYSVYLLD